AETRTSATSLTGSETSSIMSLTARALSAQAPRAGLTATRSPRRPSSRTTSPTRCNSLLSCALWSTTSLKTEAISRIVPLPRLRRRTLKSPSRIRYRACRLSSSCSSASPFTPSGIRPLLNLPVARPLPAPGGGPTPGPRGGGRHESALAQPRWHLVTLPSRSTTRKKRMCRLTLTGHAERHRPVAQTRPYAGPGDGHHAGATSTYPGSDTPPGPGYEGH